MSIEGIKKMQKIVVNCILASNLMCVSICWSADTTGSQQAHALSTSEDAFERAMEFTGFRDAFVTKDKGLSKALATTSTIVGQDDESPFVSKLIDGKEVWHITFDSIFLDYKEWHPDWVIQQIPKTFHALLDPQSGAILKIYTRLEYPDSNIAPEPPANVSTESYRQQGDIFLRVVSEPPQVSFYDALEQARCSSPLKAKEITAWLTMMKLYEDTIPHPIWVILGRGVPFAGIHGPAGREYEENRWVSFVDATSGRLLSCGTAPSVGPPETWKKK